MNTKVLPLISVVIPTYNRYDVLKRAIKSVYNQTHQAKEIIVIDDGSTEATSQILNIFPKISLEKALSFK